MAKRRNDNAKVAVLREARVLNPRAELVTDEAFAGSEFLDARDLVQVKYEMVRRVRVDGEAVSVAAATFGFSRPSWYTAAEALDTAGLPGLLPARPGPHGAHKITDEIVAYVEALLEQDPSLRPVGLADRVAEAFGLRVHPRSIGRALARPRPKSR